jgi:transcriptional regulator with XRE-family HTH domain
MYYDIIDMGKRIQSLRQSKGLTQEQLADQLSISTVHLAKIEIGSRNCSLDILISVATFFDTSLDYIVFGKAHSDNNALKMELSSIVEKLSALEQML